MSQFETSEVMQEYANIIYPQSLQKEAGWRDVLEVLGLEAAATGGAAAVGGGLAAATIGSGGAVGIAISILGATWLAYDIYRAATKADNTVGELIDRLESLDPTSWVSWMGFKEGDEAAAQKIKEWVAELKKYKKAIGPGEIPSNREERAKAAAAKVDALKKLSDYLDQMVFEWKEVKPRLTDWGWDPAQAEMALKNTLKATREAMQQARSSAQKAAKQYLEQSKEKGGRDYKKLATEIKIMYESLTEQYGGPPTFDNRAEKNGYDLANKIMAGEATMSDINNYGESMAMLHRLMTQAIQQKKGASLAISKRALTMGDGTKVTFRGPDGAAQRGPIRQRRRRRRADPSVVQLQDSINFLNAVMKTGASKIRVDGIYGPRTQRALDTFLSKYPNVRKWIGVDTDYRAIANKPNVLKNIGQSLSKIEQQVKSQVQTQQGPKTPQERQTEVQYGGGRYDVREQPYKWNPTTAEVLAALSNKTIDGVTALQWLTNRGFSRSMMKEVVKQSHPYSKGFPPSNEWDPQAIKQYVKENYPLPGRHSII